MSVNLKVVATFSLVCGLASVSFGGETTSEATGGKPIPKELAGLRDRWVSALDEFQVPGIALVVVKDDKIIYQDTFGYRDLKKKLPVTPDTQFYIASCTKAYTAAGIMTLVDQGKLKLDDPVKKYLPRMELPGADVETKVTIRDLLSHAYGINCGPIVFLDAYTGEITDDRYYHLLKTYGEVTGRPEYTNVHFTLLGRVIEAVTGKSWRDYLNEAIFKPAGMNATTGYADRMYAGPDVATPYEIGPEGLVPATHRKLDSTMHAAGGLGTSIHDMARWLRLCMNNGAIDGKQVISSASAAEMLRLHSKSEEGRIRIRKGFGLAWLVGSFQKNGPAYASHGGGYIGAGAHMSFLPDKKIGVGILTNSAAPAAMFADNIISVDIYKKLLGADIPDLLPGLKAELTRRLPGLRAQAAKREADMASVDLKQAGHPLQSYYGTYTNKWFGTLHVSRKGDGLRFALGEMELPLTRFDKNAFTLMIRDEAREGEFEIDGERASAATLNLDMGSIRFERQ